MSGIDAVAPPGYVWSVTPSDTVNQPMTTRAVRVTGAGDLAIAAYDPATGNVRSITIPSLAAGETVIVRTNRIFATGTTATGIIAYA